MAVEIKTLDEALDWGDGWEEAYRQERRERLREIKALHDEIFWLEHGVAWRDFTITLLQVQLRLAGIRPLEEIAEPQAEAA